MLLKGLEGISVDLYENRENSRVFEVEHLTVLIWRFIFPLKAATFSSPYLSPPDPIFYGGSWGMGGGGGKLKLYPSSLPQRGKRLNLACTHSNFRLFERLVHPISDIYITSRWGYRRDVEGIKKEKCILYSCLHTALRTLFSSRVKCTLVVHWCSKATRFWYYEVMEQILWETQSRLLYQFMLNSPEQGFEPEATKTLLSSTLTGVLKRFTL